MIMKIAVLAVQGAFLEHEKILERLGAEWFEIRKKDDLNQPFDGLILPGGESSVMGRLLHDLDLFDILKEKIQNGLPVYGTCAGLILLAKRLTNDDRLHFATMDISVKRNAYGRQLGSFSVDSVIEDVGTVPMVFIRAPYIEDVFGSTRILATVNGNIVAAREGNQLVTSFHPELTDNLKMHEYFLNIVKGNA